MKKGFTLIELLVVIAIIGMLSIMILPSLNTARQKAFVARTKEEFHSFVLAIEFYADDHNNSYPADTGRNIPASLAGYLAGQSGSWPEGPWPGSLYDWDNWDDPDHPGQKIYQVSIRFCPAGGPLGACNFPDESWAAGFGIDSAYYYCVSGHCRAHASQPINYPGYCVNCSGPPIP